MKFSYFIIFLTTILTRLNADLEFKKEYIFPNTPMGGIVKLDIQSFNPTNKAIQVKYIRPSCGCTTTHIPQDRIQPFEKITFPFTVDTNQKLGPIRKEVKVYLKDHKNPVNFFISGNILPNKKNHQQKDIGYIFKGDCASCHSHQGANKVGLPLYLADCALCHGTNRQGSLSSPPLLAESFREDWNAVLAHGRNTMPGFSFEAKGPLSSEQLKSLFDFLKEPTPKPFNNDQNITGGEIYKQVCSSCHGEKKLGPIGPDIRSHMLKNRSHEELYKILVNGTQSSSMPSFLDKKGGLLTDQEIRLVVAYMKLLPWPRK